MSENIYRQLCVVNHGGDSADGFWPSLEESRRLEQIDNRLRMLMPPDAFESLSQTPTSRHAIEQVATGTTVCLNIQT